MDDRTQDILERARALERIETDDAQHLYDRAPLEALGETANHLRLARTDPEVVTYLVDRNVNYTNFCVTNCLFCAFYRPMGHDEGYVLSYDEIAEKVGELAAIGGTRILLQGGHNPDLRLSWYTGLLTHIKSQYPDIQLDAFSPSEIDHIASVEKASMERVLVELSRAGLGGLPGGGAEILDDGIRRRISRKKIPAERWLEAMEIAQSLGLTTSATMVIGFGENVEQRIDHLERFRNHQDRALADHGNGFSSFISWTFQRENTAWGRIGEKQGWAHGINVIQHVRIKEVIEIILYLIGNTQIITECIQNSANIFVCTTANGTNLNRDVKCRGCL